MPSFAGSGENLPRNVVSAAMVKAGGWQKYLGTAQKIRSINQVRDCHNSETTSRLIFLRPILVLHRHKNTKREGDSEINLLRQKCTP
jgi:hypothetical protein